MDKLDARMVTVENMLELPHPLPWEKNSSRALLAQHLSSELIAKAEALATEMTALREKHDALQAHARDAMLSANTWHDVAKVYCARYAAELDGRPRETSTSCK
jgi:hypothetical protein